MAGLPYVEHPEVKIRFSFVSQLATRVSWEARTLIQERGCDRSRRAEVLTQQAVRKRRLLARKEESCQSATLEVESLSDLRSELSGVLS